MINKSRDTKLPIVRLLTGVRNTGYTFESAILDIIDNSIAAHAKRIYVSIESEGENIKNQISRVCILDDGDGMNIDEIYNALQLGSPNSEYETNSVSKYGFGLKSAGLSQADLITVISRDSVDGDLNKSSLNWEMIETAGEYLVDEQLDVNDSEKALFTQYGIGTGTLIILEKLIKVSKLKKNTAVKKIQENCSITFHRFIQEDDLKIVVNGREIEPYDPLFCDEIKGLMTDYDGTSVTSYLEKDFPLVINTEKKSKAIIKAVLLPNPPLFEREGKQKEIGKKYRIYTKNIGFYIYRNRRLINEATTLSILSRSEPRLLASRIRIDIDSSCDDDVNLDIKKTQVIFPEMFMEQLKDLINPYLTRSKTFWDEMKAKRKLKSQETESDILHERSNKMLEGEDVKVFDTETGNIDVTQDEINKNIDDLRARYNVSDSLLEEIRKKAKDRIIPVSSLDRSMLWKPSVGEAGDAKVTVLLSRCHPFYERVYKNLTPGDNTIVILDALFLNLAMAEMGIDCRDGKYAKIFEKLRQSVSYQLENFIDLEIDEEEYDGEAE